MNASAGGKRKIPFSRLIAAVAVPLAFWVATPAQAHCDGLDGPVVKSARQALETGDAAPALAWVGKDQEAEVRDAFARTLKVRKLDPAAREMADRYFFETLVRVHRQGEGAPYTGLKPAGTDPGAAVRAGDKALEAGSVEPVIRLLTAEVKESLAAQYKDVMAKKKHAGHDVESGRRYVEAYVAYIHTVEKLQEALKHAEHAQAAPVGKSAGHAHH